MCGCAGARGSETRASLCFTTLPRAGIVSHRKPRDMLENSATKRILLVDDDPNVLATLAEVLLEGGYTIETAADGKAAIELLESDFFELVITDMNMPGTDGMEVLRHVRRASPETACVMLTGYGTIRGSVEAMKLGAFDYITKPVKMDELLLCAEKAIKYKQLERENSILRQQLRKKYRFENFVGDSEKMQRVFQIIEKVADTDSTVLITGESGTGKELIARAIHYNSRRKDHPLVVINCGAIPEDLLESELFGHEKGAFTGAHRARMGRFELADRGTIFLDEIGDMSPALQVKILRVLQEQTFERIGSTKTLQVDIRIIAATNKDLLNAVKEGDFREDLYYRLNVIPITVPPLRERRTDIPLLVDFFIRKLGPEKGLSVKAMTPETMQYLIGHNWPGNVRELENLIERLLILSGGDVIVKEDLPETVTAALDAEQEGELDADFAANLRIPKGGIPFDHAVEEYEKQLILQALKETNWVKARAAKLLSINRTTLIEKMKRKNIQGPSHAA